MGNAATKLKQLEELEEIINGGILTIKYSDREMTYRSMDDMIRARDLLRSELGLSEPMFYSTSYSKGLTGER